MKSPLFGCTESVAWGFLAAPFRADDEAAGLSREYSLQMPDRRRMSYITFCFI